MQVQKQDQIIENSELMNKLRKDWETTVEKIKSERDVIPESYMSNEKFFHYVKAYAKIEMARQGDSGEFIIDKDNELIIRNLYHYLTYNSSCAWNLNKGIIFTGPVGTGKSILLKAFINIINDYKKAMYKDAFMQIDLCRFLESQQIVNDIIENSGKIPSSLLKPSLVIDELGRESTRILLFGNEFTPLIDLLFSRYSKGLLTHATSNYKFETLASQDRYGVAIGDRLRSMMTFVEVLGKSRRK